MRSSRLPPRTPRAGWSRAGTARARVSVARPYLLGGRRARELVSEPARMGLRADEDEWVPYPNDRAARIAPAPHGNVEGHIPMRWAGGWRVMDGSKMLKEIREQPEVLGRVLD